MAASSGEAVGEMRIVAHGAGIPSVQSVRMRFALNYLFPNRETIAFHLVNHLVLTGTFTVCLVTAHELGHAVGLSHSSTWNNTLGSWSEYGDKSTPMGNGNSG